MKKLLINLDHLANSYFLSVFNIINLVKSVSLAYI